MDPFTQGTLGAVAAQSFKKPQHAWAALVVGWLSGMAADLDVLIRSDTDPLVYYQYHRHFTHSLFFIPFAALLLTPIFYFLFKKRIAFKTLYLFSFLGYATHGLLDACTSYGTLLLWPLTDQRFAWSNIAIVDLLFTFPIFVFCLLSLKWKSTKPARLALIFSCCYLLLGWWQKSRAESLLTTYLRNQKIQYLEVNAKPTILNNILWRVIVKTPDQYLAYGIRIPWWGPQKIYDPAVANRFDFEQFNNIHPVGSQQDLDIRKFSWFSQGYLVYHPKDPNVIADFRYGILPNSNDPLWGLKLKKNSNEHTQSVFFRDIRDKSTLGQFIKMLRGN